MIISMQGNWTVRVKSKLAAFPQQFKIIGAAVGNGTYTGDVSTPPVNVIGQQWSIAVLNNPGGGFQSSDVRIKFPQKIGINYTFDIESNDAGNDKDFDDLILTCSTPATINDFIVYGNVTLYSGPCWFNPCFWKWIVIDSYELLQKALKIPELKDVIQKIYPERMPPIRVNPNPPDPAPDFKPLMISLVDDVQLPAKQAQLFKILELPPAEISGKKGKETTDTTASADLLSNLKSEQIINAGAAAASRVIQYDKAALARAIEPYRKFICDTEPAANQTLGFDEYDRSLAELAGNPYTGAGNRLNLGNTITDMNGNYIFRFTQSLVERWKEYFNDYAAGEDHTIQILPDVIVKVEKLSPVYQLLYETAPFFNIGNLKRVDICLPKSKVPPVESFCFNGNIIDEIGKVYIGGTQNNAASFLPAALDRNGFNNHLRPNGVITTNTGHFANPLSGFSVDCACWGGTIDIKGCLFNEAARGTGAKQIHSYTIRYKKSPADLWQYVTENMLHPLHHKLLIPNYVGDPFGPFTTNLNVDGGGLKFVPAYNNIQREAALVLNDWEAGDLSIIITLNTHIYQGSQPGTVYFRIDGYDELGNPVANSTDMIAVYIDNNPLDFGLADVQFPPAIEYVTCGLYKMLAAELNTPLQFRFKAGDLLNDPANPTLGFVNDYSLTFGKCPSALALDMSLPVVRMNITDGVLAHSPAIVNTEAGGCVGYKGTVTDFSATGYVNASIQPNAGAGWLSATETYGVYSLYLTATRRVTNGYNTGIEGTYVNSASFSIIKK
jgi:hypothetical protein